MSNYTPNTPNTVGRIRAELDKIQASLEDKLDRDPDVGQENMMKAPLDMNGFQILNAGDIETTPGSDFLSKYTNIVSRDVASMIASESLSGTIDLAQAAGNGGVIDTVSHNEFVTGGGARYLVVKVEDYTRNTLGSFQDGRWLGIDYLDETGNYVFQRVTSEAASDKSFGVVGTVDTALGLVDDYPALAAMFEYCRIGQALGGKLTGGTYPVITPRSLFYVSDTLDLIDFRVSFSWGSSELRPMSASVGSCINYESAGNDVNELQGWADHLEEEDVFLSDLKLIHFSGGQPVAVTSETPFSKPGS